MTHNPAFGTLMKWDPAGGTTYVAIGQVKDISGPNLARGDIDVTTHDSTSGYREYLPGLADGGDVSFAISLDPDNTAHVGAAGTGLVTDFTRDGCTMPAWQVTLKSCGSTAIWTFDGYLNGMSFSSPLEDEQLADVSVKITGVPALAIT